MNTRASTGSASAIPSRACSRAPQPFHRRDKSAADLRYHHLTPFNHRSLTAIAPFACALVALPVIAQYSPAVLSIIERVVARIDPPPHQYRALRRLEAQSDKRGGSAWIEAWTAVDPSTGFLYQIIG